MRPGVLLEVVFPPEGLPAGFAREGPESGVDPFVAGQFFVSGEALATAFGFAPEWSLS